MGLQLTTLTGGEIWLGEQNYNTNSTQTLHNHKTASTQTLKNYITTSTQTKNWSVPTRLKLIGKVKTDNECVTVCHYKGYTHAGQH